MFMLDTVMKHRELTERCSSRLHLLNNMSSDNKWKIVKNLVQLVLKDLRISHGNT